MAEEQASALPEELEQWLDDRVADTDQDRDEVLARAVATYRLLSEGDEALSEEAAPPIDQQLAAVEQRIEELDEDTDERIQDVRDRVVQVMKTAKGKADPDHDHPELDETIESLDSQVSELSASQSELSESLSDLRSSFDALEERVDGGFENYETILSSLTDRADEIDDKLDTLAGAIIDLRERAVELEAASARRSAVEELQADANLKGVQRGNCEACSESVHLGLLSKPSCPRCGESFDGIEPGGRFIGAATITVGDRPALAGESFEAEGPEEIFEDNE